MFTCRLFLACATIFMNIRQGLCICYFPGELQGEWATQRTTTLGSRGTRSPVSYQEVVIESDKILQWGTCHARADNNVILMDSNGGSRCYRCVYLNVASPKVVQVWTMGLETCYTSEEAAVSTCPPAQAMASKRAREIMLYKVRSLWGEPEPLEIECPLNGRFTFTYRRGHNGASTARCNQPTSEFSNCPYGFGFNVLYRDCSFATPLRTGLQCLGSWVGEDDVDYFAVMDTSVKEGDGAPQFKCGMFHEEAGTGRVFLAFSEDSTCTNSLISPTDAYETYELMSVPSMPLPPSVSRSTCKFPRSLLGHWHHTYVADDTIAFKDYRNFKTYSARCVRDQKDGERYIVYVRTHCGDWAYNCLWLKRRSANVLEFMLGLYPQETFDDRLCDVGKFGDRTSWTTQGKSLPEEPTTCPIIGNYMGELPDAIGYCAQLYSDCRDPQIMFYTVSDCSNSSVIYEREDLPGPTSEAGPWLPPEQKVSTGAVLTIVDEARGRGRRQAGAGRLRVANARTTTISWLWGSSTTAETTTTTTTSTTTTTTTASPPPEPAWRHSPLPQPPPVINYPSNDRDYERRHNPDPFLEDRRPPADLPPARPPADDSYDAIGFWPNNRKQPEYPVQRESPAAVPPPPVVVPGSIREVNSDSDQDGGVPGRATWVPGAPPGFQSQSSPINQPLPNENGPSFSQNSQTHASFSSPQSSTSSNSDGLSYLPTAGADRQPLKQEREYQCLGQWEEEGRVYALTYRRDIRTYECFVGVIKSSGVVFIKEAGNVCSRGVHPEVLGMKLRRKGESCPQPSTSSQSSISKQREDPRPRTVQPPWLRTTRPWKPITEDKIVSCKVGKACFTHDENQRFFEDNFSVFMRKLTGKGKILKEINYWYPDLRSENSIVKKKKSDLQYKNAISGPWKLPKYFMAEREKRDANEKTTDKHDEIKHSAPEHTSHNHDDSDGLNDHLSRHTTSTGELLKFDLGTTSSGSHSMETSHGAEDHSGGISEHLCNSSCSVMEGRNVHSLIPEDSTEQEHHVNGSIMDPDILHNNTMPQGTADEDLLTSQHFHEQLSDYKTDPIHDHHKAHEHSFPSSHVEISHDVTVAIDEATGHNTDDRSEMLNSDAAVSHVTSPTHSIHHSDDTNMTTTDSVLHSDDDVTYSPHHSSVISQKNGHDVHIQLHDHETHYEGHVTEEMKDHTYDRDHVSEVHKDHEDHHGHITVDHGGQHVHVAEKHENQHGHVTEELEDLHGHGVTEDHEDHHGHVAEDHEDHHGNVTEEHKDHHGHVTEEHDHHGHVIEEHEDHHGHVIEEHEDHHGHVAEDHEDHHGHVTEEHEDHHGHVTEEHKDHHGHVTEEHKDHHGHVTEEHKDHHEHVTEEHKDHLGHVTKEYEDHHGHVIEEHEDHYGHGVTEDHEDHHGHVTEDHENHHGNGVTEDHEDHHGHVTEGHEDHHGHGSEEHEDHHGHVTEDHGHHGGHHEHVTKDHKDHYGHITEKVNHKHHEEHSLEELMDYEGHHEEYSPEELRGHDDSYEEHVPEDHGGHHKEATKNSEYNRNHHEGHVSKELEDRGDHHEEHVNKQLQDNKHHKHVNEGLEDQRDDHRTENHHEVETTGKTARSHHLDISANETYIEIHDKVMKVMAHTHDDVHVIIHSETDNNTYEESMMDFNTSQICKDLMDIENTSSAENITDLLLIANCSDWMNDENGTTDMDMYGTTDDSDIPKIPISLIEYPTAPPTTDKPSMVTLPPMIWQPFAQPGTKGRPRHRGSGSTGFCTSSQPGLILLLVFFILANYV